MDIVSWTPLFSSCTLPFNLIPLLALSFYLNTVKLGWYIVFPELYLYFRKPNTAKIVLNVLRKRNSGMILQCTRKYYFISFCIRLHRVHGITSSSLKVKKKRKTRVKWNIYQGYYWFFTLPIGCRKKFKEVYEAIPVTNLTQTLIWV